MTEPEVSDVAAIHRVLRERAQTVSTAESLTGGLLAAALTETAGSSATFRGGLIVYATPLKSALAGVDPELLAQAGPVDARVAEQLAVGVRLRLSTNWGLSTTGVAGPSEQDGHPVGEVFVAVAGLSAGGDELVLSRRLALHGDRNTIRVSSVTHALALLADVLKRNGD